MDDYDTPLFGEQKQSTKIIQWSIMGVLIAWVLYNLVIAILFGLKGHPEHFVFAFLLICAVGHLILGFVFYKMSDQEEKKFMWNCVICLIMIFLIGATLNVYVWMDVANKPSQKDCDSYQCVSSDGGYWGLAQGSQQCIVCPSDKQYIDTFTGVCMAAPSGGGGNCTNGTNPDNKTMVARGRRHGGLREPSFIGEESHLSLSQIAALYEASLSAPLGADGPILNDALRRLTADADPSASVANAEAVAAAAASSSSLDDVASRNGVHRPSGNDAGGGGAGGGTERDSSLPVAAAA